MATFTNEVLVLASGAVRLETGLVGRTGLEIQNLGPNPIWIGLDTSGTAVVNKSRKLNTGESWSLNLREQVKVYAIASTADQVTGAATVVTEVQ